MAVEITTQELDEFYKQSRAVKRQFESQWFLNLAYYHGKQWVKWDGQRLFEPELEPWRIKLVDNRIMPTVRTEVAKLTKTRPTFVASPNTAQQEDVMGAQVAEEVLDFLWQELDLTFKHHSALMWSRIAGAGFWKVYWDSMAGDAVEVVVNNEGQPMYDTAARLITTSRIDPSTIPGASAKTLYKGEICVEVRSPYELFPDPFTDDTGLGTARWIIEETVQDPAYVKERWGVTLEADTEALPGLLESRLPGLYQSSDGKKGIKVREFWAKPCAEYPNGAYVVWAKEQILYNGENPYPWLPYVMFKGIPAPGRFWPTCVVEHLISPQTELNKRKAQIAENAARIGNPPLLQPASMGDFDWQGFPGEKVKYQDFTGSEASVPRFMQVPEMGGYIREDVDRIVASIQDISAQHEVSAGQVPPGVTAASAINLLQEQDDTQLGPAVREMEVTLGRAGTRILELVNAFYDESRMVRIAGEDGMWNIYDFKRAMLHGNTQIRVEAGSGMPRSKAAKQAAFQDVLNLILQYGGMQSVKQTDLRKFLRDYEVGGLERLFGDIEVDESQVQRENQQLAQGKTLPINEFDDDAFHINGHTDFQKGARYSMLNDRAKAVTEAHVNLHRQRMAANSATINPPSPLQLPPGPANGNGNGGGNALIPPTPMGGNPQNG